MKRPALNPFHIRESALRVFSWALLSAGTLGVVFDWSVLASLNPGYMTAVGIALALIAYRFGRGMAAHEKIVGSAVKSGSKGKPAGTAQIVWAVAAAFGVTAAVTWSFLSAPQIFVLLIGSFIAYVLFTVWRRHSLNWALAAVALLLVFLITVSRSFPADTGYPVTRLMAFLVIAALAVSAMAVVALRVKDRANRIVSRTTVAGAAAAYLLAWFSLSEASAQAAWEVGGLSLAAVMVLLGLLSWSVHRPKSSTRFLFVLAGGLAALHAYLFWDSVSVAVAWLVVGLGLMIGSVLSASKTGRYMGGAALGMAYLSYMLGVALVPSAATVIWWQQPSLWVGLLLAASLAASWFVYLLAERTATEKRIEPALSRGVAVATGSVLVVTWLASVSGVPALVGLLLAGGAVAVIGWRAERVTYLAPAALLTGYAAVQILALDALPVEQARLLAFLTLAILVVLVASFIHSQTQRLRL